MQVTVLCLLNSLKCLGITQLVIQEMLLPDELNGSFFTIQHKNCNPKRMENKNLQYRTLSSPGSLLRQKCLPPQKGRGHFQSQRKRLTSSFLCTTSTIAFKQQD